MKRFMSMILLLVLMLAAAACGSGVTENSGKPATPAPTKPVCQHSYSKATCLEPAKCIKCGKTTGGIGSHVYEDGVCRYCNEEDPDWEPPLLTGAEYERINSLMEGMYQFRLSSGNLVEYNFKDGEFVCYTQLGGQILQNSGTYVLTEKTLVLYYQNGTVKDCPWKLNASGQVELFLLDLT